MSRTVGVMLSARDLAALLDLSQVALRQVQLSRLQLARLLPEGMDNAADDLLIQGQEAVRSVVGGLQRLGAVPPHQTPENDDPFSFAALSQATDPAVQDARQTLAAALVAAVEAANDLDRLQGNWWDGETGPGEPQGTNYAEALHQIACRLNREMTMPQGRD